MFTFMTPKSLYYRFKRLVMGNNPASLECHRGVCGAGKGCEDIAQIKDHILVNGTEETHKGRLRTVLHRLQEAGFMLQRVKCELGMSEVEWFGHRFSGAGMRVAAGRDLYIPIFYPPGGVGINIGVGKKYDPKTWSWGKN